MIKNNRFIFYTVVFCLTVIFSGCNAKAYASDAAAVPAIQAQQVVFTDGVFRITTGGQYILSGEHEGKILVETTRSDAVVLILDGAVLHNPAGQAIFAPRSRSVEIILTDGTINSISDGSYIDEENNAAIFIQHDLIISGNGTLNVTGNYQHGIRAQDFLTINSGIINVNAKGDALRGRDGVIINSGNFNLTAGGDGIQSNNDSNPDYGFITINGGTFTIKAGDDGMQAETTVTINNGNIVIAASDDGITTNGSVIIAGGYINITDSYEGIEGLNVTITGGNVNVYARDDGINARDGALVNTNNMRGGWQMMRGPLNPDIYIRITGGTINVHAFGDGIDSNNNIFFEGGILQISGQSMGMEGAIDCDGAFLITGGELITAGSVINVSGQSTQPLLYVSFNQQYPSGTKIEVRDAKDKILLNYTSLIALRVSVFTSHDFKIGETYSLYINDNKTNDITLGSMITNLGGSGNMGMGGRGMGGMGGGGLRNNQMDINPNDIFPPGGMGGGNFPEMPNVPNIDDIIDMFGDMFRNMPDPGDLNRGGRRMDQQPRL